MWSTTSSVVSRRSALVAEVSLTDIIDDLDNFDAPIDTIE
jgi:hypothetical protein